MELTGRKSSDTQVKISTLLNIGPAGRKVRLAGVYFFLKRFYISLLLPVFSLLLGCPHYSTTRLISTPPTLVSIVPIASGYELRLRAGNPELLFSGYRLYVANRENDSRFPADLNSGVDCVDGILNLIPNQPLEYSIELSPNSGPLAAIGTGENPNRICKMNVTLSSGQYLTLRSHVLVVSITNGNTSGFVFSMPSNSLKVP
ncbi:hypothetical protein KHM19_15030 [Leptospira borgpetersenii]|uniref:Uncharacterized protein n=1 Tax=Leptospira borgpetersenii serovar Ballum TaxID=280505 RepID=A0A0S2IPT0_LEPBO|nr:hypothetical protein LBBP_01393 [Leptospira borgpetersenii serovar Ballum]GIM18254.1 hypothetical protein KHM09_07050 [Leptospira borgpetersenii]GIM22320.1 hypothetical protein KHM19_15030 [Leptospira borgpetersenii]GIM25622.1 hypothetical protein KHM25_15470 [Leptospira borgpetersenii]